MRVLINWGGLGVLTLSLIWIQHIQVAEGRTPLPPATASLSPRQRLLWASFPDYNDRVPVLEYHGVDNRHNYLAVSRDEFARQMEALHVGDFHTISMAQYARYARGEPVSLPDRPILITFDDGRLDSYRGADATLAKYGFRATIFVVPEWPDKFPGFALNWNELRAMQASGRWDVQEHAGRGHTHIPINRHGKTGEFYAYRRFVRGPGAAGHLESFADYKRRVVSDVLWGERRLGQEIPFYKPLGFAIPYSNYGQRVSNDPRIARFFLSFLHAHFPVVVDGDYLSESTGRPAEPKGRFTPMLSYRITQGPQMESAALHCRIRHFVLGLPRWTEYECLRIGKPGGSPLRIGGD
jgi:Polysaccharide deacetylase